MAKQEKKQTKALATVTADPFALFDRADEEATVRELAGAVVEAYLYKLPKQKNPRTGKYEDVFQLSKPGVDAVCRELARKGEPIREEADVNVVRDEVKREAYVTVRATRYMHHKLPDGSIQQVPLDSAIGVKRQPFNVVGKGGAVTETFNQHWYEHAVMKAARNARRRLIPEALATKLIESWSGDPKRVQELDPQAAAEAPTGPPTSGASKSTSATPPPAAGPDRQKALKEIRDSVRDVYGPGAPWEGEERQALLRETFGTVRWEDISQRMPDGRFREKLGTFRSRIAELKAARAEPAVEEWSCSFCSRKHGGTHDDLTRCDCEGAQEAAAKKGGEAAS